MPEFLSDEWVAALDAAGIERGAVGEVTLVVQQVVSRPGGTEVRYHLTITDGQVRVAGGDAPDPHVTFSADYEAARAIQQGELNAQHALAHGRLRVGGDLNRLLGQADGFAAIGDVFRSVRAETTYDA